MKRIIRSGWPVSLAACALTAAVALGTAMVWADTSAAPAPAAVAAPNRAAAQEAFKKAREYYQQEKYAESNVENERALQLDPTFSDALLLRSILKTKLGGSTNGTATEPATTTGPVSAIHVIKASDITLIRFYELAPDDYKQIRGTINRKTLDDFWNEVEKKGFSSATKKDYDDFVNPANFADQLQRIRQSGDAKYVEKIQFTSDPAALLTFKKTVHPFVLQNCATAACHAGDKAGNFRLLRPASTVTDPILYTNFYIMSMYAGKDGASVIDRDRPEKSTLLQYSMPHSVANQQHPGKIEVRQIADTSSPVYQSMLAWIKTLAFPRPNYGLNYEMPGATTAPASQPAK